MTASIKTFYWIRMELGWALTFGELSQAELPAELKETVKEAYTAEEWGEVARYFEEVGEGELAHALEILGELHLKGLIGWPMRQGDSHEE